MPYHRVMAAIPPPTCLGPALRRWRFLNRVKQSALATDMGVSQATISRWEAGTAVPAALEARRLMRLLTARPSSAADRALLELVRNAGQPAHLICDLTHRLLAASNTRLSTWRVGFGELAGTPLWRFASQGIETGEAALESKGWYEAVAPDVTVLTERAEFAELTIRAGEIRYTRMPLSDGGFARLVTDGPRSGHA